MDVGAEEHGKKDGLSVIVVEKLIKINTFQTNFLLEKYTFQ